jgi:ABC-type cobalamin transport system ATPase subunit
LSELIAYSQLHPISPGMERMLAALTHMVSISGGVKQDGEPLSLSDFITNTLDEA